MSGRQSVWSCSRKRSVEEWRSFTTFDDPEFETANDIDYPSEGLAPDDSRSPPTSLLTRSSDVLSLSHLAEDDTNFQKYLDGASCYYALHTVPNPKPDIISEILGELPDHPDVHDLSFFRCLQRLEVLATLWTNPMHIAEDQNIVNEASKLLKEWGVENSDQHAVSVRRALMMAKDPYSWGPAYLGCLEAVLTAPPTPAGRPHLSSELNPLREELFDQLMKNFDEVFNFQDGNEHQFRRPLDYVTDSLRKCIPGSRSGFEHQIKLVFSRAPIERVTGKKLGYYGRVDLFTFHELEWASMEKPDESLLKLLVWGDPSTTLNIPISPQEFKPITDQFDAAVNQLAADLMTGAAVYELLDIQFPLYGLVVTPGRCAAYVARAKAQEDGSLKFAVQKLEEWGPIKVFPNYLKYFRFLNNHQAWFESNVLESINSRGRNWVIEALHRKQFKPWSIRQVSSS